MKIKNKTSEEILEEAYVFLEIDNPTKVFKYLYILYRSP